MRPYRVRLVGGPADGLTTYHFQVKHPDAALVDALLATGWRPHEADAQAELETTVLFGTSDEEVALAWLPVDEWATTPMDIAMHAE